MQYIDCVRRLKQVWTTPTGVGEWEDKKEGLEGRFEVWSTHSAAIKKDLDIISTLHRMDRNGCSAQSMDMTAARKSQSSGIEAGCESEGLSEKLSATPEGHRRGETEVWAERSVVKRERWKDRGWCARCAEGKGKIESRWYTDWWDHYHTGGGYGLDLGSHWRRCCPQSFARFGQVVVEVLTSLRTFALKCAPNWHIGVNAKRKWMSALAPRDVPSLLSHAHPQCISHALSPGAPSTKDPRRDTGESERSYWRTFWDVERDGGDTGCFEGREQVFPCGEDIGADTSLEYAMRCGPGVDVGELYEDTGEVRDWSEGGAARRMSSSRAVLRRRGGGAWRTAPKCHPDLRHGGEGPTLTGRVGSERREEPPRWITGAFATM
ncbi:hypothetical protein DFP72DRAFT_1049996 [Ephemerocybe angulata]|uniref:Uncharacterized protein n=1 Tax=Ephemerocybe angulata TaxID=980116 RepID=A0A8H6LZH4_9AGAR|nr:hypothetical protein DFP72DRAFT_1049996 [Tulosesus angulatus]